MFGPRFEPKKRTRHKLGEKRIQRERKKRRKRSKMSENKER
jgi:hypothetical protein